MLNAIRTLVKEEDGASAAEYALLLVIITLGISSAVNTLGNHITTAITRAASCAGIAFICGNARRMYAK